MLIKCPKCNFEQPPDQYCANCGINITKYHAPQKKKKIWLKILKNPFTHVIIALIIIINIFSYINKKKQEEIRQRFLYLTSNLEETKQQNVRKESATINDNINVNNEANKISTNSYSTNEKNLTSNTKKERTSLNESLKKNNNNHNQENQQKIISQASTNNNNTPIRQKEHYIKIDHTLIYRDQINKIKALTDSINNTMQLATINIFKPILIQKIPSLEIIESKEIHEYKKMDTQYTYKLLEGSFIENQLIGLNIIIVLNKNQQNVEEIKGAIKIHYRFWKKTTNSNSDDMNLNENLLSEVSDNSSNMLHANNEAIIEKSFSQNFTLKNKQFAYLMLGILPYAENLIEDNFEFLSGSFLMDLFQDVEYNPNKSVFACVIQFKEK